MPGSRCIFYWWGFQLMIGLQGPKPFVDMHVHPMGSVFLEDPDWYRLCHLARQAGSWGTWKSGPTSVGLERRAGETAPASSAVSLWALSFKAGAPCRWRSWLVQTQAKGVLGRCCHSPWHLTRQVLYGYRVWSSPRFFPWELWTSSCIVFKNAEK